MNLIHLLSGRHKGKVVVKLMEVMGENDGDERLKKVSKSQSQLAKELDVRLKFNMVKQELAELRYESLGCDGDKSLVVNFYFKSLDAGRERVNREKVRDESVSGYSFLPSSGVVSWSS